MDAFEDRERRFEARYAYDEAHLFRIRARRAQLTGLWAAGLMGLDDADAYARTLVEGEADGARLRTRIIADLRGAGVALSEHRIDKHLERWLEEARRQVMEG